MKPKVTNTDVVADVLIVGGGFVGLTLAVALAGKGLAVAVVDRVTPEAQQASRYDGRASAIALGSWRVFEAIGVGERLRHNAQPILDIRVADGRVSQRASPLFLHFDHREVGEAPFGYMIENRGIRHALFEASSSLDVLQLLAPNAINEVKRDASGVVAVLDDGRRIAARLLVAADGRSSATRASAGIRVREMRYAQTAIVATVRHQRAHEGVAVEQFLPSGPFAMLPMTMNRSNIVWTESSKLAASYSALSDAAFCAELGRRFGDWLGGIELEGPRFSYPLGLMQADRYTARRLVLAGDAAHVIHPIAGQGLNLGLRDAAALAEIVVDSHRLGLDVGDSPLLGRYERWRRFDNTVLAIATDGLNRLFSNDFGPLRVARDIGLAAVGKIPPLRQLFMRQAMGVLGTLPRLVRGEPL
jgi:2-octaprenyl-6-methoxyphenol hydroxylase